MNVSVINRAPVAVLETMDDLEDLTEGDNLTLTGFNSNDTANDNLTLVYRWDASHLDTDLDGVKTGDVDYTGETWTIENLPAGPLTFVLTVIDDDGLSDQKESTVLVGEAPPDGIFETISSAVGTTPALVIGVLGITILGLLGFLLFTRRGKSEAEDFGMFEQSQFASNQKTMAALPETQPLAEPAPAETVAPQPEPMEAYGAPVEAAAPISSGPPLPATGLPEGWTMEQWNYYGEQWRATNQPAPAPVQPIVSQTPPTTGAPELQSLLDDLDI